MSQMCLLLLKTSLLDREERLESWFFLKDFLDSAINLRSELLFKGAISPLKFGFGLLIDPLFPVFVEFQIRIAFSLYN